MFFFFVLFFVYESYLAELENPLIPPIMLLQTIIFWLRIAGRRWDQKVTRGTESSTQFRSGRTISGCAFWSGRTKISVTKNLVRGENRSGRTNFGDQKWSGRTNFGDQKWSAGPLLGRITFAVTARAHFCNVL